MSYINPLERNYPNPFYFFTATILKWQRLFDIHKHKDIVISSLDFMHKNKRALISGFVIMPNHIHLIIMLNPEYSLASFKRDFLKYTAQKIKLNILDTKQELLSKFQSTQNDRAFQIWERRPLATALYSVDAVKEKLDYIHNNPCKSEETLALSPADYHHSSAYFYNTGIKYFEFLQDYRSLGEENWSGW
ncbi:MAG: transposase [Bacteroidia bacterium]|nr:transposase [Bacteroidia bacterium]MCO5254138.1 transposase [Bacteroidota bacterium]MCZ2129938.1 transposase [Bacteroidia bacterium]